MMTVVTIDIGYTTVTIELCVFVGIRLGGDAGAYYDYRHQPAMAGSSAASTGSPDMVDIKLDPADAMAMYRGAAGTPHGAPPPSYCSPTHDAASMESAGSSPSQPASGPAAAVTTRK